MSASPSLTRYFPFQLSLQSPLLATGPDGDPNSATTLPYIPGSLIRGAVARGLGDPGADAARLSTFRDLILTGDVRYLNAYPVAANRRALPALVALRNKKGSDDTKPQLHFDLLAYHGTPAADHELDDETWPEVSLGGGPAFLLTEGSTRYRVRPSVSGRTHQQRDRPVGRAWKEANGTAHGTVFTYEALDAGQTFGGVIAVDGAAAEIEARIAVIREKLGERLLLGRSRRAGYGGDAAITWQAPRDAEREGSHPLADGVQPGTPFQVTLLAPYLGRDAATGQLDPTALEGEVIDALAGHVSVERRGWSFARVGGYNRTWGLPLPQAPVARAGSALLLRATAPIPLTALLSLEHAGLGERRVEGFGRVAFSPEPVGVISVSPPPAPAAPAQPPGQPTELTLRIQRRLLVSRLEQAILREAARLAGDANAIPSPNLLGRLRLLFRQSPEQALRGLLVWLGDGNQALRPAALRQLERCALATAGRRVNFRHWLEETATTADLGALLSLDVTAQRTNLTSEDSARADIRQRLPWLRARLIEAVITDLMRESRREHTQASLVPVTGVS